MVCSRHWVKERGKYDILLLFISTIKQNENKRCVNAYLHK